MAHGDEPRDARDAGGSPPRYSLDVQSALVSDGFTNPNLVADDAPPPYGELHDQLQFSQPGFEAGANVTEDGRVNININQKNSRLSELLGATIRNQAQAPVAAGTAPQPPAYIPPTLGGAPGQTPPPRLNVVVQIVGSRGDVQPFVALGKVLRETYGHRVRVATHPTFQGFVEENGLEFFSIGGDPSELMAFMVKNPGLMPGFDALKTGEVSKRRKGMQEILMGCWRSCIEPGNGLGPGLPPHPRDETVDLDHGVALPGDPANKPFIADAIIANPPSFAHIHVAEKLGIPLHMMFTMPWSPTRAFPHPLANITSSNTDDVMTNYLSYALVEMMTWQGLGDVINQFRSKVLDLEPLSLFWAPGLLTRLRIPYTYCWSPSLIPKPNDWQNNVDISGFFFLDLATSYTPEPELAAFLKDGPPPVYIGFGSIVVDDPNALTRIIFDAIHVSGVRALVSKGWGGLGADDVGVPPGVFMVGNCPHDWLFQHVSCVVHHGGAGTMAAGVRAGKPTVIIPFFGDQPFWGAMIDRAGAGPPPIPYEELTAEKLAQAMTHAMKPETAEKVQALGRSIREERGADKGGKSFHDHLDVESLRCALAPARVAAWRVRRTKVRLSPFAAAVLVSQGVIAYSDLKLWRPRDYNTDNQPWDPISAVTASLVADISNIAMAVADFPRGMFQGKKHGKHKDKGSRESESRTESSHGLSDALSSLRSNESRATIQTVGSTSAQASAEAPSVMESPAEKDAQPQPADSVVPGAVELPKEVEAQGAAPSVTVTSDESAGPSKTASFETGAIQLREQSPGPGSPGPSHSRSHSGSRSGSRSQSHSRTPSHSESPYQNIDLEDIRGAGMSVRKIVTTGIKSPMNLCLGLAKGFRNAPRLYNDETVRPPEKVHDLTSGLKVAGREFGFGMYDGLSGLVTQPLMGAQKEGGVGLVKGFGRGLGGAFMKSSSALVSIPAYTMQGAYMALRNRFAKSVENYISTSRVLQGGEEYDAATPEERADIVARWEGMKVDLKNFYALKLKEAKDGKEKESRHFDRHEGAAPAQNPDVAPLLSPRSKGESKGRSGADWKRIKARDLWRRGHGDVKVPAGGDDEDLERAIRMSVKETSRGDAEDDARVEMAVRASVNQLQVEGGPLSPGETVAREGPSGETAAEADPARGEVDLAITDEEYQELIERAIKQSTAGVATAPDDEEFQRALERSRKEAAAAPEEERDAELRRAIEESRAAPALPPRGAGGDEDEELRRAIEASAREEADRERKAKSEEEIVLEYVMRQSLREEEYKRAMRGEGEGARWGGEVEREVDEGPGKGKGRGEEEVEYEEDEEELRRAVEMSMRAGEQWGGEGPGPSSHGKG